MTRRVADTYANGLRDAVDLAFTVKDLIDAGMPYTATQALDILIGLMQLSVEISAPEAEDI